MPATLSASAQYARRPRDEHEIAEDPFITTTDVGERGRIDLPRMSSATIAH
jgi:hypothetical protein